jgi:cytochrome c553
VSTIYTPRKRPETRRVSERRAEHTRYKQDVKDTGKPFHPYAMLHDTIMSLIVVAVIVGLAVVWRASIPEGTDGTEAGAIGPLYTEKADPGTTSFIPRPDWYFYFLFYLLRIFKWPETVVLGTVGIPTILLVIMLLLPFIDVRRERRLSRRPVAIVTAIVTVVAMGVLTYKGATAEESLGADAEVIEDWMVRNNLPEEAEAGATLFAQAGCQQCHTYLGTGSSNLGAPDLTAIGAESERGVSGFQAYVADPSQFGNNQMPAYANLGEENLENIAIFLDASKGEQE